MAHLSFPEETPAIQQLDHMCVSSSLSSTLLVPESHQWRKFSQCNLNLKMQLRKSWVSFLALGVEWSLGYFPVSCHLPCLWAWPDLEPQTSHAPEHVSVRVPLPDLGWEQLLLTLSFVFGPGPQSLEQCHPHLGWIFPPHLTQSRTSYRYAQRLVYHVTIELVYIEICHHKDQSFKTFSFREF